MKTKLQTALAAIAPSICIVTLWEHDPDSCFDDHGMTEPGGCFEGENPDDWQAWQSEVRATAIIAGEEITGEDYLGGTWERAGDNPAQSNPEISGYENQMTQEALCSLAAGIPDEHPVQLEISAALNHCKAEARRAYDEQRARIEASRSAATV